jgi:hypothetical protein
MIDKSHIYILVFLNLETNKNKYFVYNQNQIAINL